MVRVRMALVPWALLAAFPLLAARPAPAVAPPCGDAGDVTVWWSPRVPRADRPLRILAVGADAPVSGLTLHDPLGRPVRLLAYTLGGPPWGAAASVENPEPGTWRVEARRGARPVARCTIGVSAAGSAPPADEPAGLVWDARTEAFFSAWIEHLFDAPPDVALSAPALQNLLRDRARNFLHDHLGLGEDDEGNHRAVPATPDCADLPYFLRAYFAWKLGLPAGMRACDRGAAGRPPRCGPAAITPWPGAGADPLAAFASYSRRLMDTVHSGNARTALDDDATDFYPVALDRRVLRPGVIYADPYGHTLVIVKWVPQTPERSGLLLAVDAQPDNSVSRKRFWEGTFLFPAAADRSGAGFKAFRPIVPDGAGRLVMLTNAALTDDPRFLPYSDAQATLTADAFHAHMRGLINPRGLDPVRAYEDTLDALVEQLETRVAAVDRGEAWVRANPRRPIAMPDGPAIFETVGPWEDFSTPARDLRLLIALRVLTEFADSIVRHPGLYRLGGEPPHAARARIAALHARRIHERHVTYTRSDGSPWTLSVADLLARRTALEMAYNPNDCLEIRWGAAPGTEEYATCRRHAPAEQRARMERYRVWFRELRRPTR